MRESLPQPLIAPRPIFPLTCRGSIASIYRSQAKADTTSFFAYASVYLIRRHHRVTLAIHPVRKDETLVSTITRVLTQLTLLKVKVKSLVLDRGFYSIPVIWWLKALQIPLIIPAVKITETDSNAATIPGSQTHDQRLPS